MDGRKFSRDIRSGVVPGHHKKVVIVLGNTAHLGHYTNVTQVVSGVVNGLVDLKVAEFPKLALKHGILLNLPI